MASSRFYCSRCGLGDFEVGHAPTNRFAWSAGHPVQDPLFSLERHAIVASLMPRKRLS
jgi:hypothetical protein